MRTLTVAAAALVAAAACAGCSFVQGKGASAVDVQVGECLQVGGTADMPEATKVACGSAESNFKVVATVDDSDRCPTDVDSYYSQHSAFSDTSKTVCMDIDWVVGGCMNVDPTSDADPFRVSCDDTSAPHRQRATQILTGVAGVDQCESGLGYPYEQRQFTVCVENLA